MQTEFEIKKLFLQFFSVLFSMFCMVFTVPGFTVLQVLLLTACNDLLKSSLEES